MHNPKVMEMLEAVGDLVKNIGEIPFSAVSKVAMKLWLFNNICQGRRAQLQRDIEETLALLLSIVSDN